MHSRVFYAHPSTSTESRFKSSHAPISHYSYEGSTTHKYAAAARTPPAAQRSARASTPVRSTTPVRAAATPARSSQYEAATPEKRSTTSSFMTQAARGDVTPRHQISRPTASHAATAPLRRGPSLLPRTSLDDRMLLVLDMDETLLHADVTPVRHDISFVVRMDNGSSTPVYVKFRPDLHDFLDRVSRLYEVVVFTASISRYANQVLDHIDPTGARVHHRLYREHCTDSNGSYVKDLERLGRPLSRVAIVDNSPVAYSFHPENAVAIPSWYECDRDRSLTQLLPHLERMARSAHVYDHLEGIRRQLRWE